MGKRSKYGNRKKIVGNIKFDSGLEAKRWTELQMLAQAHEITDLERQVPIHLEGRDGPILTPTGRKMRYMADFRYFDVRNSAWVIEDAKGYPTPEYKIKRAILKAQGVDIVEVRK